MELSYYSKEKLQALEIAISNGIRAEAAKEISNNEHMVELTYMLGEVRCAIDDKEIEERRLKFGRPSDSITYKGYTIVSETDPWALKYKCTHKFFKGEKIYSGYSVEDCEEQIDGLTYSDNGHEQKESK